VEQKAYWVGLNLVKGIGAVRFKLLTDFFGSARQPGKRRQMPGYLREFPKAVSQFSQVKQQVDLEKIMEKATANGVKIFTWLDADYPRRLKEIDQSPPVLFVIGSINVEDDWAVAVVGTRRVTPYGRQVADEIGRFLAQNGITVVSGLARGVDAIAHQAALQAGEELLRFLEAGWM